MATKNSINSDFPVDVPSGGTGQATLTDHGILVGAGVAGISQLAVGASGNVLLGSVGADPVFALLTSGDGSVVFTPGPGTLDLSAPAVGTLIGLDGDAGAGANPVAGRITITGGNNIGTNAAAAAVTVSLNGMTEHTLQVGNATNSLTSLGVATDGQLLIGSSAADPVLAALTAGVGISVTNAAGSIEIATSLAINAQVGTAYTLVLGDASKLITMTNGAAITLTIPTNAVVAFPIGTEILLQQGGAGKVTLAHAGVTLQAADGSDSLVGQYSIGGLIKIDTDVWIFGGDIE